MAHPYYKTLIILFTALLNALFINIAWAKDSASISNAYGSLLFKNNRFYIKKRKTQIIELEQIAFNYEVVRNWQVQAADKKEIVLLGQLSPDADFYRVITDEEKRYVKLSVSAQEKGFRFHAAPGWGRQVSLKFKYLGDHFFGLSEPLQPFNQLSPDLTGYTTVVDVNSEDAQFRENYASAYSPFYISTKGYGAFFDSFARGRYSFAINGENTIEHDTGTLDWYVFLGNDGPAIHRAYFELIGEPKSVPLWALGPVGWRDQNNGGVQEILDDVKKLSDLEIPFTSWFVDRPYSDGNHAWSKMNFNEQFAKPEQWIKTLKDKFNLEFMTWVSPATFGDARFNKHLAGKFSYMDLSDDATVNAYQYELTQKHHKVGVKGHKIDRADEGFPEFEEWQDKTPLPARRNKYAYLMAKIHDEPARRVWGEDQFTFARTAVQRTQQYLSAIWGGDPRTTWAGLQGNMANAMRSSFLGFPVWGTDVGGYQGEGFIPEDLYTRWLQMGSMTGLFEIKLDGAGGAGQDRMPWQYEKAFQTRFKNICDERMALLPYLYSLANTSAKNGVMMQPLAYRHLNDKKTYSIYDEFYLGSAILVAPILTDKNQRSIYLPSGSWRNYNKPSEVYEGGREYTFKAPLDILPRFIKENSIFVSGRIYWGSDVLWRTSNEALTAHVYPAEKQGRAQFTYVDGLDDNKQKNISVNRSGKIIEVSADPIKQLEKIELYVEEAPLQIQVNGQNANVDFDLEHHTLTIMVEPFEQNKIVISYK